jgi:hypothetical protein
VSGRFASRLGAVRKQERAVVKEMSQEELKAKMNRGDDFRGSVNRRVAYVASSDGRAG